MSFEGEKSRDSEYAIKITPSTYFCPPELQQFEVNIFNFLAACV
jgi:hypothetical protein